MTQQMIHVPSASSAVPDGDDDEAAQQTLAYRTTQIRQRRAAAYSGQVGQAERVVKHTRVELKVGVADDNVVVPIPLVDRGRGDPRNILGVIVNRDLDTDQYYYCRGWSTARSIFQEPLRPLSSATVNS